MNRFETSEEPFMSYALTGTRHRQLLKTATIAFGVCCLWLAPANVRAQQPQPDPAGIATGDKTNAIDAAGNPFVVPEPTDKADPEYANKKKAYDEFQAQAA